METFRRFMSARTNARFPKNASISPHNRFERHSRLTLTVTLVCSIGLTFLAAEMIARLIHPMDSGTSREYRIPDPRFGWVLMPGANYINRLPEESVPVSYNAEGWRDLPHSHQKTDGVTRVLVLGDSFMEATSVRFEDALPAKLEDLLSTPTRPVEVINFGVGGYSTLQEYLVFNALGRAYHPDVVVLAMFLNNDLAENSQKLDPLMNREFLKLNARPFLEPGLSESDWRVTQVDFQAELQHYEEYRQRHARLVYRLLQHSTLWRLVLDLFGGPDTPVRLAKAETLQKTQTDLFIFGMYYCTQPPEYRQAWGVTRRILTRLNREVRAAGARLLVMSVPAIEEVDKDMMAQQIRNSPQLLCLERPPTNRHLSELLEQLNIEYLDLLPAFREMSRQTGVELFRRSDRHWNPAGHALAARKLAEALERRKYLASPAAEPDR